MHRNHFDEAKKYLETEDHTFTGLLMATISKAQGSNLEKLLAAFPEEAAELKDREAGNHGPWDASTGAPRTPRQGNPTL